MMTEIRKTRCGENRFVKIDESSDGIQNILQFYLSRNCMITIEPRNAIMTRVRLEWTLEEFYADGGTTRFVDRLSASLGINP